MKYRKKPKHKLDSKKFRPKKDEDLSLEELYKEQLRKKTKYRR
jgi:hypothetical protein